MRWLTSIVVLLSINTVSFAQGEPSATETAPSPAVVVPQPIEPSPVIPTAVTAQRQDLVLLDSVMHEDSWWVQLDGAVSMYDPRRDVVIARASPGVAGGYRFSSYGVFGAVQLDQSFDFTLDIERLDVLNLGVGFEYLSFLGHVRSSVLFGSSILLTETFIDEAGTNGWFVEMRPSALRWAINDDFTFEFSPIALDVIAPVTVGIPLVIYSYSTVLSVEWSPK